MIIDLPGVERPAVLLVSHESSCGYLYMSWAGIRRNPSALVSRGKKQVPNLIISTLSFSLEQIQEGKQQTWASYGNLPKLENFLRLQQSGEFSRLFYCPGHCGP